jgi:glucose-1-phosphate adenylyltransferase
MRKIATMVLAGGRGKRMGVLCENKPKPALPFASEYRVIDFSLSNCLNSQINDIAVLTGYQRSYLGSYLNRWQSINGKNKKIITLEPKTGSYQGTADAVFQNLQYLSIRNSDLVLVLAADHIYKMDYRKLIEFHLANQADATVAVIPVPIETAHQ